MRPVNVFQLEMGSAVSDRRSFLLRIGVAFLLGFPFVMTAMPMRVKTAGVTMLVVFISFFGAAVGMARRRTEGLLDRLRLLPLPLPLLYGDLLLAGALIDILQAGPVFIFFLAVNGQRMGAGVIADLAAMLLAAVVALNLLGMLLGALARSNQEVHLFAALGAGVIMLVSGIIPVPARLTGVISMAVAVNPLARTLDMLSGIAAGAASAGGVGLVVSITILAVAGAAVAVRSAGR